jgi:hypothetical protein
LQFLGVEYETYHGERHTTEGVPINNNIADAIYQNLPKKHHVLKKAKDCDHCGAIRFEFEGPAFCCRKGRVGVFIPAVPEELKRLSPSKDPYVALGGYLTSLQA